MKVRRYNHDFNATEKYVSDWFEIDDFFTINNEVETEGGFSCWVGQSGSARCLECRENKKSGYISLCKKWNSKVPEGRVAFYCECSLWSIPEDTTNYYRVTPELRKERPITSEESIELWADLIPESQRDNVRKFLIKEECKKRLDK